MFEKKSFSVDGKINDSRVFSAIIRYDTRADKKLNSFDLPARDLKFLDQKQINIINP